MKTKNNRLNPKLLLLFLIAGTSSACATPVSPESAPIKGTVTDSITRTPVKDVCVTIKNTNEFTLTDEKGQYSLPASPDSLLVFLFPGYAEKEIKISSTTLNLQLSPKPITSVEEILKYKIAILKVVPRTTPLNPRDTIRIRGTQANKQTASAPAGVEIVECKAFREPGIPTKL